MIRQISLLCKVQLCNLFGINEVRHTKDSAKKKKYVAMACLWGVLLAMLMMYVVGFVYGMVMIGADEVVPLYLYTVVSLIILIFTFFKAGSQIFSMKTYEMLVSLPVSKNAIVVSRFLNMYVTNLLLSVLVIVPGTIVYGIYVKPGFMFYVVTVISTLFLPLLPLTLASIVGAVITAISARMKHRSLGETVLMLLFVVGILGGSMLFSGSAEQINVEQLQEMVDTLTDTIGAIYLPAVWYKYALEGSLLYFVLLLAVPFGIFLGFVWICGHFFQTICTLLNAVNAKNNYKMEKLKGSSALAALTKKEFRRYFSSSAYVTNTIVGYVLAVAMSIALFVGGTESIMTDLEEFGMAIEINRVLPFLITVMFSISSISSCSISMEGKYFWNVQVLPISNKIIYDSKILVNLIVAAPFYVISALLICFGADMTVMETVWVWIVPLCYIIFMAVLGITVNLKFPVMKWEQEVKIVKQSASVGITMLVGMVSSIIPCGCVIVFGREWADMVAVITVVVIAVVTLVLYRHNNRQTVVSHS